jgi:hypothetical protein
MSLGRTEVVRRKDAASFYPALSHSLRTLSPSSKGALKRPSYRRWRHSIQTTKEAMMVSGKVLAGLLAGLLALGGVGAALADDGSDDRLAALDAVDVRKDDAAADVELEDDSDDRDDQTGDGDNTKGDDDTNGGNDTGDRDSTRGFDGSGGGDNTPDRDNTAGNDGTDQGHNTDGDATAGNDGSDGGDNSEVAPAAAAAPAPAPAPVYDGYSDDGGGYAGGSASAGSG